MLSGGVIVDAQHHSCCIRRRPRSRLGVKVSQAKDWQQIGRGWTWTGVWMAEISRLQGNELFAGGLGRPVLPTTAQTCCPHPLLSPPPCSACPSRVWDAGERKWRKRLSLGRVLLGLVGPGVWACTDDLLLVGEGTYRRRVINRGAAVCGGPALCPGRSRHVLLLLLF